MNIQQKEEMELRMHRIRKGLITFKDLSKIVLKNKSMTYQQFLELQVAAVASKDYNDALLLNKLTVLYPVEALQ
jgi:hypothetical protein